MNRALWLVLSARLSGLIMISSGGLLFSTGLSADNAGTGQQSGTAIIPLPVVGTGTALLILVFVFSGPLFEKNSQATAISHF